MQKVYVYNRKKTNWLLCLEEHFHQVLQTMLMGYCTHDLYINARFLNVLWKR